ncbi:MAG: hypothetical protein A2511_05170 [Deltaproteobacteria bacterium RIFOXYD12_FULL_50_9]|nr:MAG: hypothetical protein A2511_05170 [Deltaproteobacteria bacterium RIFOXYD12_FULL_50_9]
MDGMAVKEKVKERYQRFAREVDRSGGRMYSTGLAGAGRRDFWALPLPALDFACGCGDPVQHSGVWPGASVVDLGCGSGADIIDALPVSELHRLLVGASFMQIEEIDRRLLNSRELQSAACLPETSCEPEVDEDDLRAIQGMVATTTFRAIRPPMSC